MFCKSHVVQDLIFLVLVYDKGKNKEAVVSRLEKV